MDYSLILNKIKLSDVRSAINRARKISEKEGKLDKNTISMEKRFLKISSIMKKYELTVLKLKDSDKDLRSLKIRLKSAIADCASMIDISSFLEENIAKNSKVKKFEHDNKICNYFFYKELLINYIYGSLKSKIYELLFVKYFFIKNIKYKKATAKNEIMNKYISYISNDRSGKFFGDGGENFNIVNTQKNLIKMYPCVVLNSVIYNLFFIIDIVLFRQNMSEKAKYKKNSDFYIADSYIKTVTPYLYMKDISIVIEKSKTLDLIREDEIFEILNDAMKFESRVLRSYYKTILKKVKTSIGTNIHKTSIISEKTIDKCYTNIQKKNQEILSFAEKEIQLGNYDHEDIAFKILFSMFAEK
jgi:hypothetical protein